jgi:hypothetical protein
MGNAVGFTFQPGDQKADSFLCSLKRHFVPCAGLSGHNFSSEAFPHSSHMEILLGIFLIMYASVLLTVMRSRAGKRITNFSLLLTSEDSGECCRVPAVRE